MTVWKDRHFFLKLNSNIMKTFLSKQKYQVYAIGVIALYFLTRFFY